MFLITFDLWPNMTSKHPLKIYSPNFDSLDAINPDKLRLIMGKMLHL